MKIGQTVEAKFKTLPVERAKSEQSSVELCPLRRGRVAWIHPRGRFITVTTQTKGGHVTENFLPGEVRAV